MEAMLNSPLQVAWAVVDPPPKPPDSAKGSEYTGNIYSQEKTKSDLYGLAPKRKGNLMKASLKDKTTRGTLQEMGQDESDSNPDKARTGNKPKEKYKDAPQIPHNLTLGADFHSHPLGKSPHLGRGIQNSTEPD